MSAVRDLTPRDADAVADRYDEYEWWADRDPADVRRALAETAVAVGIETDGAWSPPHGC